MAKAISKQQFLNKLLFRLSFHYNTDESSGILQDYEEWFEQEERNGKKVEEICLGLESPKAVVSNLLSESGSKDSKGAVLAHNPIIQLLALTLLRLLAEFIVWHLCANSSMNYLYFAMGMNLLYFVAGMVIAGKKGDSKTVFPWKGHLLLLCTSIISLCLALFVVPQLNAPTSGKISVILLNMLILILFLADVLLIYRKALQDKSNTFLLSMHLWGIISVLLSLTAQFHMLYNSISEYRTFALESGILYLETVILCSLFYMGHIHTKR